MPHTEFDFNNVGKRLPYTVPDGYFENLEESLLTAAKKAQPSTPQAHKVRRFTMRRFVATACAVAAVVAIAFGITTWQGAATTIAAPTTEELAQAFDKLTPADQTLLLELYQDDPFIYNNTSDNYDNQ